MGKEIDVRDIKVWRVDCCKLLGGWEGDKKKWEEQLFLKEKLKIPEMHFQFKGIQWIPSKANRN